MSALGSIRKRLVTPDQMSVKRTVTGQVEITLADKTATVDREKAIQIAAAILDCAGVGVNFVRGPKAAA